MSNDFVEDANEYCLSLQVPGCEKESITLLVNKLHLKVSTKYNVAKLVSPNDFSESYLKNIPDLSLLQNNQIEIKKNILLPWNADINFIRAKLDDDGVLSIIVPKLENPEVLPEVPVDIETESNKPF